MYLFKDTLYLKIWLQPLFFQISNDEENDENKFAGNIKKQIEQEFEEKKVPKADPKEAFAEQNVLKTKLKKEILADTPKKDIFEEDNSLLDTNNSDVEEHNDSVCEIFEQLVQTSRVGKINYSFVLSFIDMHAFAGFIEPFWRKKKAKYKRKRTISGINWNIWGKYLVPQYCWRWQFMIYDQFLLAQIVSMNLRAFSTERF